MIWMQTFSVTLWAVCPFAVSCFFPSSRCVIVKEGHKVFSLICVLWNKAAASLVAPRQFGIHDWVLKASNTWAHKHFVPLGTFYRVTECHILSPVPRLLSPGACFLAFLIIHWTVACAAFLVLLHLNVRPTPAASGSEPPGRIGDPSPLVQSLYQSHQDNAPAASPAPQVPDPGRHRSAQRLSGGDMNRGIEQKRYNWVLFIKACTLDLWWGAKHSRLISSGTQSGSLDVSTWATEVWGTSVTVVSKRSSLFTKTCYKTRADSINCLQSVDRAEKSNHRHLNQGTSQDSWEASDRWEDRSSLLLVCRFVIMYVMKTINTINANIPAPAPAIILTKESGWLDAFSFGGARKL